LVLSTMHADELYTCFSFFFQAEDGIRDRNVTGVQTCALPIWTDWSSTTTAPTRGWPTSPTAHARPIGNAPVTFTPAPPAAGSTSDTAWTRPPRSSPSTAGAPSPGSSPVTRCSPWITAQGCRPGNHFWTCTCFPRCGAHSCTCGARDTPH